MMKIYNPLKKVRLALAVGAAAAALTLTSGCFLFAVGAAGAAGAGTVAYVEGRLTATLGKPYEAVSAAAGRAVQQLQFFQIGDTKDALSDMLVARTAEDKKIKIVVTRISDQLTRVEIRVGTFGDQAISQTILDRINANL